MSLRMKVGFCSLAIALFSGCPTPQQDDAASNYRFQAKRTKNGLNFGNGINFSNGLVLGGNGIVLGGNGVVIGGNGTNIGGNGTNIGGNGTNIGGNGTNIGGNGTNIGGNGTNIGGNGPGLSATGSSGTGVEGLTLTTTNFGAAQTPVTGLWLTGSELNATIGGQNVRGAGVVGMEFHYSYLPSGTTTAIPFTVKISSAELDPTAEGLAGKANDVWMYNLEWKEDNLTPPGTWKSFCITETGQPDQSLMISNRWDMVTGNRIDQPTFISFACRDYALAKCARMGYRPWAKATSCSGSGSKRTCTDIALTDHHQSCTRMMRADYCGNGKSYTVNGTLIDIYDYLNPPLQVPETDWDIEARWTPTGAICLNDPRHPELIDKWRKPDCNGDGKPDKFSACGQSDNRYSGKGLVVNRFNDDQSGCGK